MLVDANPRSLKEEVATTRAWCEARMVNTQQGTLYFCSRIYPIIRGFYSLKYVYYWIFGKLFEDLLRSFPLYQDPLHSRPF